MRFANVYRDSFFFVAKKQEFDGKTLYTARAVIASDTSRRQLTFSEYKVRKYFSTDMREVIRIIQPRGLCCNNMITQRLGYWHGVKSSFKKQFYAPSKPVCSTPTMDILPDQSTQRQAILKYSRKKLCDTTCGTSQREASINR